jgi:hypothetical protein
MYGVFGDKVTEEITAMERHECKTDMEMREQNFGQLAAEQRTKAEGETTALGDGYFVTAAGEAWYRYRCRPLQVQVKTTPSATTHYQLR